MSSNTAEDGFRYYGPRPNWQWVDVAELWRFRELIWTFAQRDLKIRYRQTAVGAAWAILQPLLTMAIFAMLFGLLNAKATSSNVPYAITCLCGLVPWMLFAGTITASTTSLVQNQNILQKVYFPKMILPLASLIPPLVDFAIAFGLLLVLMPFFSVPYSINMLALPLVIIGLLAVSLAVSLWLSALNAIYRDVQFIVPFMLQIGMFISPVVYEMNATIPEKWRWLYSLNPMAGILELFRWSILGLPAPSFSSLAISLSGTLLVLLGGMFYFRRMERFFSDRI
ncbi:ABC transporter permease [Lacunimicrobium album]